MDDTEGRAGMMEAGPVFRPAKRRKFYRKRDDEEDEPAEGSVVRQVVIPRSDNESTIDRQGSRKDSEESEIPAIDIARLRKLARARKGGIAFTETNDRPRSGSGTPLEQPSDALVVQDDTPEEIRAVTGRFAPQTGQVADVNQHMMAFIDAEIAKRLQGVAAGAQAESSPSSHSAVKTSVVHSERQPAALGKLHEIDLGPSATLSNIERTAAAQRKLEDGSGDTEPAQRLGKDGKPRRGEKRRTSEDMRRDRLVEEVLRESRLEIYDDPDPFATQHDRGDEDAGEDAQMAADDRIAEQFRREFMDAISSRQRRRAPAPVSSAGGKKDERPKGPKLGGSRSARAAMREMQEKQGPRK